MAFSRVDTIIDTGRAVITFEWTATESVDGNYTDIVGQFYLKNTYDVGYQLSITGGSKGTCMHVLDLDSNYWWQDAEPYARKDSSVKVGKKIPFDETMLNVRIPHNIDGTKNIKVTLRAVLSIAGTGTGAGYINQTIEFEMELPEIPRQTDIITSTNFTDEDSPTITYMAQNKESITALEAAISFDGYKDDISYRTIPIDGTSYTFNFTYDEQEIMWQKVQTSTKADVYFLIRTTRTGTENGQLNSEIVTKTFTAKVMKKLTITDCIPAITPYVEDVNETTLRLTGNRNVLVKYFSNAKADMNLWLQKSATLKELYIKNGVNKAADQVYIFNNVNYNVFDFYVIDSRGESNALSRTLDMVEYVKVTCNLKNNKPDADGEVNIACSGNYFNASFGAVNNELTVQWRYKEQGGEFSEWANMNVTYSGNTYNATAKLTGLDYQKLYVFETRATDLLMSVSSGEKAIKSLPVFHWSGEDFVHETPVEFKEAIKGDVQITGDLRLKGESSNYGNTLYFGDTSYTYLSEEADDELKIRAGNKITLSTQALNLSADTNIYGSLVINGGSVAFGSWTPTLGTSGAVSSYDTQQGWYMKLGTCVLIGFNIKANCNSGYEGTALKITGVPFTPKTGAFGGGVAFNIYIGGNFNFESWAIDTSKNITPRMQPSNNTSAGNLNISSTAGYPSGGGSVTLGGTVCFSTSE